MPWSSPDSTSSASGARRARSSQLGGLLVGPEDWFDTFKGRTLLSRLRAQSAAGGRIPPLIVGVQEGGIYRAYPGPAAGPGQLRDRRHERPEGGDRAGPPGQAARWPKPGST